MKRFDTLPEAAELAATLCKSWSFVTADERYDAEGLLALAEISDSEDPIDEDCFYNEDLPMTYQAVPQIKFCTKCGSPTVPGARFCSKCGIALRSK